MDENAKKLILNRLRVRNKKQSDLFADLIHAHTALLEKSEGYKQKNLQLSVEVERIKLENIRLQSEGVGITGGNAQGLEQKLFKLQEELTSLHRERGKNAQQIIDLNNALQEKEKEIHSKDNKIHELENKIFTLEEIKKNLEQSILELTTTNQMLTDEQQALQLAFTSLEGKFRELQEEYNGLVSRWIALKAQDANRLNDFNQKFYEEKQQKVAKMLEDAAEEEKFVKLPGGAGPGGAAGPAMPAVCFNVSIPNTALCKFDAHDGEVNAVKWTTSGRLFATGGADRKLKLWEVINGKCENRGILTGSNAAIMSVDFDSEENTVLAASNDFACRVWTLTDQRLRHTLTGHSAKVLAAKYMGDPNKVVSGSHDRTLKIWDLRSRVCVKTIFAGSSCNDLITTGDYSNTIISGHFDKKVRFWDTRSDSSAKEIALGGKVVSVDLSPDRTTLLACSRDETIKLIDLRMNQVSGTLSGDGFRTACDWTRAVFSPDGSYIMAGSADSTLYVWNVARKRVEKTLKDHQQAIVACSWHPNGSMLLSCDKQKQVILWSDF